MGNSRGDNTLYSVILKDPDPGIGKLRTQPQLETCGRTKKSCTSMAVLNESSAINGAAKVQPNGKIKSKNQLRRAKAKLKKAAAQTAQVCGLRKLQSRNSPHDVDV
jgi:hypothetical protein